MEEVNSKEILEVLNKIKDSKEFSEKIQTKILELKDAPSEEKAKKIFLKELSSTAKKLGYNLSEADFENYFKSKEGELSDDALAQASGGRNNFWSWLAVGAGTLAGGIGMLASGLGGSLGGLFGGGSGGNTDTRPQSSYTQNIDRNRGKSVSDNVFKNTGEEKKSDEQTRSPDLNGGQGYGRYNSSSRLRSTPKKITSKYKSSKIKTSPSINLTKTKDATNAKTAEKKKEKKDNKAVIDVKKAIAKKKDENKQKKPEVKVVKVVDNNKKEAEKNLKELQAKFKIKMDTLEKDKEEFIKIFDNELGEDDNKNYNKAYEFIDIYGQAESDIKGMEAQCKTLGVKPEEKVEGELKKWEDLAKVVDPKRNAAAEKFKEKIKKLDEATTKQIEEAKKEATENLKKISDSYENAKQENEKTVESLKNACEEEVKKLEKIHKKYEEDRETPAKWYLLMSNQVADKDAGLEDKVTKKIETEEKYFKDLASKYVEEVKNLNEENNNVVIQEIKKGYGDQNIEKDLDNQNENGNNQLNINKAKNNNEDNLQEVQILKKENEQIEDENQQDKKEKKNEININQVKEDKKIIEEKNEEEGDKQINIVKEEDNNEANPQEEQEQKLLEKEDQQDQKEKKGEQDEFNISQFESKEDVPNVDNGEKEEKKEEKKVEEDDDDMGLEDLFNVTGSCEYLKNKIEKQTEKVEDASKKDLKDLNNAKAYQQEALKAQKQLEDFKTILGQLDENEGKKTEFSNFHKTNLSTIKAHLIEATKKVDELSIVEFGAKKTTVEQKTKDLEKAKPTSEEDKKDYEKVKAYKNAADEAQRVLAEFKTALEGWKVQEGDAKNEKIKKEFEEFCVDKSKVIETNQDEARKMLDLIINPQVEKYKDTYNQVDSDKTRLENQMTKDIDEIDNDVGKTEIEKMKAKQDKHKEYKFKFEELKKTSDENVKLKEEIKNKYSIDVAKQDGGGIDSENTSKKLEEKIDKINANIEELDNNMKAKMEELENVAKSKLAELGSNDKGAGKALDSLAKKNQSYIDQAYKVNLNKDNDADYKKALDEYTQAVKDAEESLKGVEKAIEDFGKAELAVNKNNNESNAMRQTLKVKGTDVFEQLRGGNKETEISLYEKNKKTLEEKHKKTEEEQKNFENAVEKIENKMKNKGDFQLAEGDLISEIKNLDQLAKNVGGATAEEKKIADEVSKTSNSSPYGEINKNKEKDAKAAAKLKKDLEDDEGQVKQNAKTIESLRKQFFENYNKNIIEPLENESKNKEQAAKEAEEKQGTGEEIKAAHEAYAEWGSVLNKLNTAYATLISRAQEAGNNDDEKLAKANKNLVATKLNQVTKQKNELQKKLNKKILEKLIEKGSAYDQAKQAYEKDKNENKIIEYRDKLKEVVSAINECGKAGVEFNEEEVKTNSDIKKAFEELKNAQPAQLANDKFYEKYTQKAVKLSLELEQVNLDGNTYNDYYKAYQSLENKYTEYEGMLSEIEKERGINDAKSVKETARKVCSQNFSKIINYVVNGLEALSKDAVLSSAADGNGLDLAMITQNGTKAAFDNIVKLLSDKSGILVKAGNEFLKYDIEGKPKNNIEENQLTVITKIQELRTALQEISKKFTDNKEFNKQKKSGESILKKLNKGRSDSFSVEEFEILAKAKSKIELKDFKPDENFDAALEKIFYDSILTKDKVKQDNIQNIKLVFNSIYSAEVTNSLSTFIGVLTAKEDKKDALNTAKLVSALGEDKKSAKGYKFAKAVEKYVTQQVNNWKK